LRREEAYHAPRKPSPAEVFPPGAFIQEELEARGWSQRDLAEVLGRPLQAVNAIVDGRKQIMPRTARELEAALGPSAEFWLNLEVGYRLHQEEMPDPTIARRAAERNAARRASPRAAP
jgi:HTH-type transcriptional regulator/antitoxin HigA